MSKNIRKIIAVTLVAISVTSLVACGNKEKVEKTGQSNKISDSKKEDTKNTSKDDSQKGDEIAEKSGSIVTLGDMALEIFGGSKEESEKYINTISKHAKNLGNDVQVYNMVVPTHVEFALPSKYKDMSNSEKESIDNIYKGMDKNVKTIDAYSELEKHKDEYIYFNTDHHWTSLGAYYAYTAFAKEAGFTPINLKEYEKFKVGGFLGTLYTQTKDNKLKNNPDTVDYYKIPYDYQVYRYEENDMDNPLKSSLYADYAEGVNAYSVFLHGDFPEIKIENKNAKSDKKIVVVKESYGNAFVPFLVPDYKEVIVIDSRYYDGSLNQLVKDNGINQVLFINNVFAANTETLINTIDGLNK